MWVIKAENVQFQAMAIPLERFVVTIVLQVDNLKRLPVSDVGYTRASVFKILMQR